MSSCQHGSLTFSSPNTKKHDFKRPTEPEIRAALQTSSPPRKKSKKDHEVERAKAATSSRASILALPSSSTFPAPLALPGDELAWDPEYPPQSVQEWIDEEDRNTVTARRKTVYIAPPPSVSEDVDFVNEWATPGVRSGGSKQRQWTPPPSTEDVVEYLQAFYHGLPVKVLSEPTLGFTSWEAETKRKKSKHSSSSDNVQYIGLSTSDEAVRIRCRPSRDEIFTKQLNLDDVLDTAISILPENAYALLMLVNHDLYEHEEDDFCCGRAYGGSRVAVISTARYRPELDKKQGQVPLEHAWPASHCSAYISSFFSSKTPVVPSEKRHCKDAIEYHPGPAIAAAVIAFNAVSLPTSPVEMNTLWLGRVCKTASHELGHCFGMDHCMYFACVMQGTASLAEDSRQPPYLCPLDLAKVLRATGAEERERYEAILKVCERWKNDGMFAAFDAWIRTRLGNSDAVAW